MKATALVQQEENKETITACNDQEEAWLLSVSGETWQGGGRVTTKAVRWGKYRLADQETTWNGEFRREAIRRRIMEIAPQLTATLHLPPPTHTHTHLARHQL